MKLSGIKNHKSVVFEDSSQGLRSSLAAKLPTIYIPSNIPAVIDKDIDFNCFIDSLGNESYKACLLYTSPSPRDLSTSRMPSSA